MNRRDLLKAGGATLALAHAPRVAAVTPDWSALAGAFRVPDWFRDAKFGIWGHWGPQCVPEAGDWYGRQMYQQGNPFYAHHLDTFGHPADTGFLDIIGRWRIDAWDPAALVRRYRATGARYVMAMAGHHDNFDLWDSRHHPWNAARVGPRRDIVASWAAAVRGEGLKLGLSNHISHAWHWWQTAYGYDPEGPRAGQRYDAWRLRAADGRGTWWEGLDPQRLYTGATLAPPDGLRSRAEMDAWVEATSGRWMQFAPPGNLAHVASWLARQKDLVERFRPDIVYLDDTGLPFGPVGVEAAAHYYDQSIARAGALDVVLTGKLLTPFQRTLMVEDVERGFSDRLRPDPWQTCTCIGDWHYNRARFDNRTYVPAEKVVQRLADVVSKNGNLLLSVPIRGDGSIDAQEEAILDGIGRWMALNGEAAIYGSRPWRVFGEGPARIEGGMHNEAQASRFGPQDIRFTVKDGTVTALFMEWPRTPVTIAALDGVRIDSATLTDGRAVRVARRGGRVTLTLPPPERDATVPVVRLTGERFGNG